MNFEVNVSWVVTPCSVVVGYHRFRGPCCLHLWVMTLCSDVVGYQRFGDPCCLQHRHKTTGRCNTEELDFKFHSRVNLKSHINDRG